MSAKNAIIYRRNLMKKSNYLAPELEKIEFYSDVVTASIGGTGTYSDTEGDVVNLDGSSFFN